MLNWFCLVGAVEEAGLALPSSDYVETLVVQLEQVLRGVPLSPDQAPVGPERSHGGDRALEELA